MGFLKFSALPQVSTPHFKTARRAGNLPSPATGLPGFEAGGGIIFSARRGYLKGEIRKYRKRCRGGICRVRGKFAAFCPSINGMRLLWGPYRILYGPAPGKKHSQSAHKNAAFTVFSNADESVCGGGKTFRRAAFRMQSAPQLPHPVRQGACPAGLHPLRSGVREARRRRQAR